MTKQTCIALKGLGKVNIFPKITKKTCTELKPIQTVFGYPSLTWTEHSNHNNQQRLAMYTDRIHNHGILLQNISTGLGLFCDDSPKKIQSETWTHPPTYIVISDFWIKKVFAKPHQGLGIKSAPNQNCDL